MAATQSAPSGATLRLTQWCRQSGEALIGWAGRECSHRALLPLSSSQSSSVLFSVLRLADRLWHHCLPHCSTVIGGVTSVTHISPPPPPQILVSPTLLHTCCRVKILWLDSTRCTSLFPSRSCDCLLCFAMRWPKWISRIINSHYVTGCN